MVTGWVSPPEWQRKNFGGLALSESRIKKFTRVGPFPPYISHPPTRTYFSFSPGVLRGPFLSRPIWQAKWSTPVGKHRFLHDSHTNFEYPGATPQRTQHTKRTQNTYKTQPKRSQNTHKTHTKRIQNTYKTHAKHTKHIYKTHTKHIQNTYKTRTRP